MNASQTVPGAPAGGITIDAPTVAMIDTALLEVSRLSELLRDFIAKHDETGNVECVTRGMLARVQQLSEAVSDCLHREDDAPEPEALSQMVHCRRTTPRASHTLA